MALMGIGFRGLGVLGFRALGFRGICIPLAVGRRVRRLQLRALGLNS